MFEISKNWTDVAGQLKDNIDSLNPQFEAILKL